MASSNKTSHYNLSQYSANDKPTYLVDYNGDMSNIDTGIYNAQSKANTNETNIGSLNDLLTTAKNNIVNAINEVVGVNKAQTENINTNTANIALNATSIGTLNNLDTTNKSNLVSAINEVFSYIGSIITTELWVNPNPDNEFIAQNITVNNLSNYSYYEIIYKYTLAFPYILSTGKIPISSGTILSMMYTNPTSNQAFFTTRRIEKNNNILSFEDAGASDFTVTNNRLIPLKIIGYK